jgi:LacI family transcriptional regulator
VAVGALNALTAAGLRAPDDVTVVGFDDLAIADWPVFGLTTVRVDFEAMARRSAELLLARFADPARPPVHERFPVQLIARTTHREL